VNKFQSEVGGPLHGGDPGTRLIRPGNSIEIQYFRDVPGAFELRRDELFVVPLYHIFGSEELSVISPGIAERAPGPYLALNPEDAERFQMAEGRETELVISGNVYRLPVVLRASLPRGIAGLPKGLERLEGIALPGWGKIGKAT
jgi:NADH-quinone oxidoreductase subunit G